MTDNLLFALILAFLTLITIINVRRLYPTLIVLLIIYSPLSVSTINPRDVFGITGLNPYNFLWVTAVGITVFRLIISRQKFYLFRYFSPPVLIFLFFFTLACLQTAIALPHIPQYGDFPLTLGTLVLGSFLKPIQYLSTGWLVYQFCLGSKSQKTVERAIFCSALIYGLYVGAIFLIGFQNGGYMQGRMMINNSMGIHANSVGAIGVYFLFSVLFFKEHEWPKMRILAVAASLCIVIISFSRISYLTTLLLFFYSARHLTIKEKTWTLFLSGMLFIIFSSMIISRVQFGFEGKKGNVDLNAISANRIDMIWKPLLPEIIKDPILGKGIFGILQSEVAKKGKLLLDHPHNGYLQVLLDMGIVGFIVVMFMMFSFLSKARRVMNHFYFLTIAMFLLCLTGHSFYPNLSNFLYWIGYGMTNFLIMKRQEESVINFPKKTTCQK